MGDLNLRGRILMEMEELIAQSCPEQEVAQDFETLHVAILKNHYNASEVSIDYHRRRIKMDILMNDQGYDSKTMNVSMTTLHANLWFRNLSDFLKSCIDYDSKNLAFYASILRSYADTNVPQMTA